MIHRDIPNRSGRAAVCLAATALFLTLGFAATTYSQDLDGVISKRIKKSRYEKFDSTLTKMVELAGSKNIIALDDYCREHLILCDENRIAVEIILDSSEPGREFLEALAEAGGEVIASYENFVAVSIDPYRLEELSVHSEVRFISVPYRFIAFNGKEQNCLSKMARQTFAMLADLINGITIFTGPKPR